MTKEQDTNLFSFTRELSLDDVECEVDVELTASGGYSCDSASMTISFDNVEHGFDDYITEDDIEGCDEDEVVALLAALLKHHPDQCKAIDGVVVVEADITPEGVISWLKADPVRMADVLARMVRA